jgi:hypothetical protein
VGAREGEEDLGGIFWSVGRIQLFIMYFSGEESGLSETRVTDLSNVQV